MSKTEDNMIMFRTVHKGYDKDDVHKYIENVNIKFADEKAKLESRIHELETELEDLDTADKRSDNSLLYSQTNDLKRELDEAKEQLKQSNQALQASEKEISEMRSELEKLKSVHTAGTANTAQNTIGNEKYNDISTKLGSILLKANIDADKIVTDAENDAKKRIDEAEKNAGTIKFDAAVASRVMTEQVKSRLSDLASEFAKEITALAEESSKEYGTLCDELKSKIAVINSDAQNMLNS